MDSSECLESKLINVMTLNITPFIPLKKKLPSFDWSTKYSKSEADFIAQSLLEKYYPSFGKLDNGQPKKLRDYQERDTIRALSLVLQHEIGAQLLAPTRTGKTYTISALIYVLG